MRLSYLLTGLLFSTLCFAQQTNSQSANTWKPVADALGRPGTELPDGVYKVGLPRSDMHVRVEGIELKPALALGGWLAFKQSGQETMVMGDLVLKEEEVAPVTRKLQSAGINQTAIHNHVLFEQPRVVYMHVSGHGGAGQLAKALHDALAMTALPAPTAPAAASQIDLDQKQVESAIGHPGKVNGGVLQFSIPRAQQITEHGMTIPPAMGTATAINFQPVGGGRAAVTGDFVLLASEVNPVIQALTANGITVTALHSHMLEESPRLFFMHFWAVDDAAKLGRAFRDALAKTDSKTPGV